MAVLPTPGGDNNSWGTMLNDFLQQSLANDNSGNGNGTLLITPTNSYTGLPNTNLATSTYPGLVQLTGDLAGSATSPALASIITAGSVGSSTLVPIISYDAKGRITSVSSVTVSPEVVSSFGIDGGNSTTNYNGVMGIDFGGSI